MFELTLIQNEISAPKNQKNTFGGYNYRSAEDIQQAVKPLLDKHKCMIVLSDEIVFVGGSVNSSSSTVENEKVMSSSLTEGSRYYIKSTATFYDSKGQSVSVSALAREPMQKKGMDASQITGSASSYARKYALSGLLLLDDQKDSDSFDNK